MGVLRIDLLRYLLVFSLGCTSYFFTATYSVRYSSRLKKYDVIESSKTREQFMLETQGGKDTIGDVRVKLVDPCDRIHIAMIATSPVQSREASECLKTILNFRSRPIVLHLFVDDQSYYIFRTLSDTWQLPMVEVNYYKGYNSSSKMSDESVSHQQRETLLSLPTIISRNVSKFVGVAFTNNQKLVLIQHEPLMSLMLLNLRNLGQKSTVLSQETIRNSSFQLECSWNKRLTSEAAFKACPNKTKAVYYVTNQRARPGYLEPVKEALSHVMSTDGEMYRNVHMTCQADQKSLVTDVPNRILQDKCGEFYYSARLKRRTHLFYQGSPVESSDPYEITLMTMFTEDRFDALELLLKYWGGPVSAVAYVTDEELLTLMKKLHRSGIVQHRKNVVFHVVYKRHRLNPINYLRNVALKNTHTPYSIFIDVDLIPRKNLNNYLKKYLANNDHTKDCLVVPVFEARQDLDTYPKNRSDLLKLLRSKAVIGYGQKGFAYGHAPTDYKKFTRSRNPYYAKYESRFEPYILMKTKDMPLYSEDVLDRMRDKVIFTQELFNRGYKFKVLPETFVVHHPHPVSDNAYYLQHERLFTACKFQMLEDHAARMRAALRSSAAPLLPKSTLPLSPSVPRDTNPKGLSRTMVPRVTGNVQNGAVHVQTNIAGVPSATGNGVVRVQTNSDVVPNGTGNV